jgi:hypothetical protein
MNIKLRNLKTKSAKHLTITMIISFILLPQGFLNLFAAELPQAVYTGIINAPAILKNLEYTDLKNSNSLVKEAIYESSTLGAMKAFGNKRFGLLDVMSKEEAIASVYRALGREGEAQKAGEALNVARLAVDKKTNPLSIWGDGYLQLAANEGLISQQDLTDALNLDQKSLIPESFHRGAAAQRQEMGFWLAKLLENTQSLQPSYGQQKLFNSFNDWKTADATKIPYLEALLQDNIMNGDAKGNFRPTSSVTKAQAAQIFKNAQYLILPVRSYVNQTGTIENIEPTKGVFIDKSIIKTTYKIRNSDGKLYYINAETSNKTGATNKIETNDNSLPVRIKDLIVYKNGAIGNSSFLKKGDRIEYITSSIDNSVQFINDLSSINNTNYYECIVNSIDTKNLLINVTLQLKLDYPNINTANITKKFGPEDNTNITYTYSNNVLTLINKLEADIKSVKNGMDVIITVQNNIVTEIRNFEPKREGDAGVVKGIVEDNNPQLGYITLYSENGNGSYPGPVGQQFLLRTFNYNNQDDIDVLKNHEKAELEDIDVGDTVFLKLDDKSNITSVSSIDNYTVKYGKVVSKKASTLAVQYENGVQQIFNIDSNLFVVANQKAATYSSIKDGDRVKILLSITNKFTKLKEITIEGQEHIITNIYKGTVVKLDDMTNIILTRNLEEFKNGLWTRTDQKGSTSLKLASDYNLYFDNKKVNIKNANKNLKNNEAYIAVEKEYGGKEQVVIVSYRNEADGEDTPYNDSITTAESGSGEFTLSKSAGTIKFGNGTIIVKEGRLVSGNSIVTEDIAYVVANRSYDNGEFNAGVVQITDRSNVNFAQIYRGRISKITTNKQVTVESFSQLNGLTWSFTNTPKTFKINPQTTIIDDSGIVNQRDFLETGVSGFKDRTIYVISNGINALMISTAPFGIYNGKGILDDITGGIYDSDGNIMTEPTAIKVKTAKVYDVTTHLWVDSKDMTLNILKNTIILKDNKATNPSALKKGDQIRVIKKDNIETGDGYIIIVEN